MLLVSYKRFRLGFVNRSRLCMRTKPFISHLLQQSTVVGQLHDLGDETEWITLVCHSPITDNRISMIIVHASRSPYFAVSYSTRKSTAKLQSKITDLVSQSAGSQAVTKYSSSISAQRKVNCCTFTSRNQSWLKKIYCIEFYVWFTNYTIHSNNSRTVFLIISKRALNMPDRKRQQQ